MADAEKIEEAIQRELEEAVSKPLSKDEIELLEKRVAAVRRLAQSDRNGTHLGAGSVNATGPEVQPSQKGE